MGWKVCEAPEEKRLKDKSWARWYSVRGRICEYVKNTETGEVKKIGLEEARACFLIPSVTTVLKVSIDPCGVEGWDMKGKNMERWFVEQGAEIQRSLPEIAGEGREDWRKRVMAAYESQSKARLANGTAAHAAFEAVHLGQEPVVPPEAKPAFEGYRRWYEANVSKALLAEETVVSKLGYAGTVDSVLRLKDGRVAVCDTKVVDGENWRNKAYPERGEQLSSYAAALYERGLKLDDALNVLVNSRTGEVHVHSWRESAKDKQKWLASLFGTFKNRLRLFQETYSYDTAAAVKEAMSMLSQAERIAKRPVQQRQPLIAPAVGQDCGLPARIREAAMAGGIER